jgi:folylpolyglutamate synthase/dihydropteroate synthase
LAENNKILAWRLISNDLIEAGIPAGLKSGDYSLEFFDNKNNLLTDKLSIKILGTENKTVVIRATPSVIKQGQRRTIVLQGIHLANAKELFAKNGQSIRLENINQINDRVLSAEMPATAKPGEYRLFIGEQEQDIKLTVN